MNRDQLLERLQKMLAWKKSRRYYAERLGITEEEVNTLLKELMEKEEGVILASSEVPDTWKQLASEQNVRFEENIEKETAEISFDTETEIRSLEELITKCKIDTEKWEVLRYVQNYWGNGNQPKWQVKAWLGPKQKNTKFTDSFKEFLKTYKPLEHYRLERISKSDIKILQDACLVINKQDAHLNKYDIKGINDVQDRFDIIEYRVDKIIQKATLSNDLEKIIYILGSDEFNSEWNGCTTRGTPQQNIPGYHDSFQMICDHEVKVIENMLKFCDQIHIIYVPGNHDEYIGWHMISWLKAYFREDDRITVDTSPTYTKCIQYGVNAMLFNHGDAMKPQALAALFPMEFKDSWSECDNFYIFTGDKHREMNADFNGIKFYGIPALSKAKGSWDHKQGYLGTKAEMTAFLINYTYGMTDIYKEPL